MIGRLTGRIVHRLPDAVLVDVGGVGYEVRIPLSTFYALATDGGSPVSLHVHTHVREDALQLYGFASRAERSAFEQLIAISGVGPKLALGILSGIGVDELRAAVVGRDRDRLQRIPGIGKKTAERVLLELGDRIGSGRWPGPAEAAAGPPSGSTSGEVADATSALVNLGYSRVQAERAVARAAEDPAATTLESLLKGALSRLVR
jgi:Holliday junction DNA helicase RuvA